MSQDLSALYPEVWAQTALDTLHENIVLPKLVTRDYDTNPARQGDKIHIFVPDTPTVSSNTADSTSYSDQSVTEKTVTIDQWKYVKYYLSDKDVALALYNPDQFARLFIVPAARELAATIDKALLQLYKDVYYSVGTAGDPPDSRADVIAILEKAANYTIPKPYHLVMGPTAYYDMLEIADFLQVSLRGRSGPMDSGELGALLGFTPWMSQNVDLAAGAKHTIGGWYDANSPLVDQADHAIGDTTIHVDGLATSGSDEIKDGDLFTPADESHSFVATADADTDSNGDADITYSPSATVAWEDGDAITVTAPGSGNTYINNLFFNPQAFAYVTRPLGRSAEQYSGAQVAELEQDGVSVRVTIGYDHEKPGLFVMTDMLYGVAAVRPECAIRVLG